MDSKQVSAGGAPAGHAGAARVPPAPRPASHARTEAVAGITTFFTMAYIVVVNPAILSTAGTGMPFSGVLTATVLVAFVSTLLMGVYARLPYAVAPGMGINAFFAYTLILGQGIPWPVALGITFWAGVLFLAASVTPVRAAIARAIPPSLRIAAAAGIGLFLTFLGLKNAGFIAADPVTLVRPGPLGPPALLALLGLAVMAGLLRRRNPFAFLAGMAAATLGGLALGRVDAPPRLVQAPDFTSVFLRLDVLGALRPEHAGAILTLLFTDLFDSLSTFMGVSLAAGLLDRDRNPLRLREGLLVDAVATFSAGLFGSSSGTAYIESTAGIEVGGRTGLTAVVTALCFLPCLFLAPLAGMVPPYATAPVLLLVGLFMFASIGQLEFGRLEEALPAFVTIIMIPFTSSITQGIVWGFLTHTGLYVLAGRARELHPMMVGLAAASIGILVWD
jgi:AGZA family xanthine/uracil permease-like MFS transporter